MPENETTNEVSTQDEAVNQQPILGNGSERVHAQLLQIMGSNRYKPTEAQVDKMLALQEKGMDYTYNERTKFTGPMIHSLIISSLIGLVIVGVFVFSVFTIPEYLDVIIAALVSLITGGVGGYGLGQKKSATKPSE